MRETYSDEDILESIRSLAEELGHSPSRKEFKNSSKSPATSTIENRFGSWNEAKKKAGVKTYERGKEMLDIPDSRDWDRDEWESLSTAQRMREKRKAYLGEIKVEEGCQECGYDENPHALSFHHKDESTKDTSEATEWVNRGWDWIENELEKCEVLCLNCHHTLHWDDGRWDL